MTPEGIARLVVIDVVAWFGGVRPRPPRGRWGGARESMLFSRGIFGEVERLV